MNDHDLTANDMNQKIVLLMDHGYPWNRDKNRFWKDTSHFMSVGVIEEMTVEELKIVLERHK